VVFAMGDAAARTHTLDFARPDGGTGAQAILILERAFQHIADDLHVAMAVIGKAALGRDLVLIDYAQIAKAHMGRVIILAEGEGVAAVEPAEIGTAARFAG